MKSVLHEKLHAVQLLTSNLQPACKIKKGACHEQYMKAHGMSHIDSHRAEGHISLCSQKAARSYNAFKTIGVLAGSKLQPVALCKPTISRSNCERVPCCARGTKRFTHVQQTMPSSGHGCGSVGVSSTLKRLND